MPAETPVRVALLACAASALLSGCSRYQSGTEQVGAPEVVQPAAPASVSAQDAALLAEQWLRALDEDNQTAWIALCDVDALLAPALAGRQLPEGAEEQIRGAVPTRLGQLFLGFRRLKEGGTRTRYLGHVERGRELWASFGQIHADGRFGQFRLRVVTKADGTIGWADQWSLAEGSSMVEDTSSAIDRMLDQHGSVDGEGAATVTYVDRMNTAVLAGDFEGALALFEGAPPAVRAQRRAHLLRLSAASHGGFPQQYTRAVREFVNSFPSDPAAMVHAMGMHLADGDMLAAGRAAEALHEGYGPDGYLLASASAAYRKGGELSLARSAADRAVAEEPNLKEAHVQRLLIAELQQDDAVVAEELTILQRDHGLQLEPGEETPAP